MDGVNQNTEWWKYENMTKYEKIGAIKASVGLINDGIIPLSAALKALSISEETFFDAADQLGLKIDYT